HVVYVLPIPERLVDAVGEAEDEQILHGLFAEIVVYAINLRLFEVLMDVVVELLRTREVCAERFLDDDAPPAFVLIDETRLAQLFDGFGVERGRGREIEDAVALRTALAVDLIEQVAEFGVVRGLINVDGQVVKPLRER